MIKHAIKNCSNLRLSIEFLCVGSALGVNGTVISLEKGKKVHPSVRGNNLVTRYGFPEVSCVITKKSAYMDYETWVKVMKVLAPGIRKMKVSNVACFFLFYSLYI